MYERDPAGYDPSYRDYARNPAIFAEELWCLVLDADMKFAAEIWPRGMPYILRRIPWFGASRLRGRKGGKMIWAVDI